MAIIPIILATIVNSLLGMFWYSPVFLGNEWAKAHNFDLTKLKPTPMHYIGAIFVSIVTVAVFSLLIHLFKLTSVADGVKLGFLLWLGFIATTHFSGVIWARKPLKAYLIDTGFQLVSLLVMGSILTYWQ